MTTNACVLTAALPVAINVYLMASEFRSEEGAASNAYFRFYYALSYFDSTDARYFGSSILA